MLNFKERALVADQRADSFLTYRLLTFLEASKIGKSAGIYSFEESGSTVYVGRTRNLQQRLRAHISNSHNSASFALKRTRIIHDLQATYRSEGSRATIVSHPDYGVTFRAQIAAIREFGVRFMEVIDPIDQYLIELAVTMKYGLPLDGFDSH